GDLDDVAIDECAGIRDRSELRASATEGFQLPIVEGASLHRDVVARRAVLAVDEDLDDLRTGELVVDGGEVEGVTAGHVAATERQRADGVEQVVAGAVDVGRREIDGDGHLKIAPVIVLWRGVVARSIDSERGVATASRERATATRGVLFAADRGSDQI